MKKSFKMLEMFLQDLLEKSLQRVYFTRYNDK